VKALSKQTFQNAIARFARFAVLGEAGRLERAAFEGAQAPQGSSQ